MTCITCGNAIRMMRQRGTDYCSDNCRKINSGEQDKVSYPAGREEDKVVAAVVEIVNLKNFKPEGWFWV